MNIRDFIATFRNHPVLFVGTGLSLRYLQQSFTWDGLLRHISTEFKGTDEYYLNVKSRCGSKGAFKFDEIAAIIEDDFNKSLHDDRHGKFKEINDIFFENMRNDVNISRLKIYISLLLSKVELKPEMAEELAELKKAKKNIGSIITTNYDQFLESFLDFTPLVGNDILLSNPYGSVYKIHGCISKPDRIIITKSDYEQFNKKYELIRAQLLSIFIHNPIVFLGYGIGDDNIKHLLKTIFNYVQPNTVEAEKIRSNFLLVEYDNNSNSQETCEHDIDIEGFQTIRINKIKTNDFHSIYQSISNLTLPISAMDIRKVQNIIKEIYSGEGGIKVTITEDLDALRNGEKILAIGSSKSIQYNYFTIKEMMSNYFDIIEESNVQILLLLNKQKIQTSQYFPAFGFSQICNEISDIERLKNQQRDKLNTEYESIEVKMQTDHNTIKEIIDDIHIANTYKTKSILWSIMDKKISLEDTEHFLKNYELKSDTDYKKLLCAYDYIKYGQGVE